VCECVCVCVCVGGGVVVSFAVSLGTALRLRLVLIHPRTRHTHTHTPTHTHPLQETDEIIRRADVIFVNNYAFDAELNLSIALKLLDLKEHAVVGVECGRCVYVCV
jgi:hypothetical protein